MPEFGLFWANLTTLNNNLLFKRNRPGFDNSRRIRSASLPTAFDHIPGVVFMSANIKMLWVTARRIIATMKNPKIFGISHFPKNESDPMSESFSAAVDMQREYSVVNIASSELPFPAFV